MFKPVAETLQAQLDNPKNKVIKLHGTITEPVRVQRSVRFQGKAVLQAPLLIEHGLQVVFDQVALQIDDWNGQVGVTDTYDGNLVFDQTTVAYTSKLIKQYETHANKGVKIGALVVSNAVNSVVEITDSAILTASLAASRLTITNSKVGYLFGSESGFYGQEVQVRNSMLTNFDLTGRVETMDMVTTGDLRLINLTQPAKLTRTTIQGPSLDAKTAQLAPLQQHAQIIYRMANRIPESEPIVINVLTISGEALVDGVAIDPSATNLSDRVGYGLALLNEVAGDVTLSQVENRSLLDYASLVAGDLKLSGKLNETMETVGHGHVSNIASGKTDQAQSSDALTKLNSMIGLDAVKTQIKKMIASATMRKQRGQTMPALHMIFSGNAGTGKTTVAETVALALFEQGVLQTSKVVRATKKDLVAEYVGQTAIKTQALIEQAYGGVLFIDEAYTLASDSSTAGFEAEAIAELIAQMENHRDDLVVILAGYTAEMKTFMASNQGLNSRFKTWIEFPDYTAKELTKIALGQLSSQGVPLYKTDAAMIMKLMTYFVTHGMNDGNGRFARNFTDMLIENKDVRLFDDPTAADKLVKADYQAVLRLIKDRAALIS